MVIAELYKVFKSWKSRIVIILAALLGILHTIDSIFYTGTDKKPAAKRPPPRQSSRPG